MRKIKKMQIVGIPLLCLLLISTCKKEPDQDRNGTGEVQFSFMTTQDIKKSVEVLKDAEITSVSHVLISIEDNTGNQLYSMEKLELYNFDGVYISEPISLATGDYTLVEFLLLDDEDNVVYATPVSSSSLAYLVTQPLPISFTIEHDNVTNLKPEVLDVHGYEPEDFGYTTFGFSFVPTFDFLFGVFVYNADIENFELTDAQISISMNGTIILKSGIKAITNTIVLRDEDVDYELEISKAGYQTYVSTFTIDSLKAHEHDPLEVILEKDELSSYLLVYMPFNGNANDESGNGYHGVVTGASLTNDRFGNTNSAYQFDGIDDFIDLDEPEWSEQPMNKTYCAWIKREGDGGFPKNNQGGLIFSKGGGAHYGYVITVRNIDDKLSTYMNLTHFPSTYTVTNGQWTHIAVTFDNDYVYYYVDGVFISQSTYKFIQENDWNFRIASEETYPQGGTNGTLCNLFNGMIDEVRIYSKVLSAEEIYQLYNLD